MHAACMSCREVCTSGGYFARYSSLQLGVLLATLQISRSYCGFRGAATAWKTGVLLHQKADGTRREPYMVMALIVEGLNGNVNEVSIKTTSCAPGQAC